MATPRGSCLFVVSGAAEGVSAQSFLQAHTLISQSFTIQLASPNGRPIEYVQQDDSNRRWFNEFRSKAASTPIGLETVDVNRYSALLIPSCPGAVHDLTNNTDLGQIISHFVAKQKPICAIGMGTAGLFSARQDDGKTWHLEDYSMTAPSVFELANLPEFPTLPVIHEDFIKDNSGKYTCSVNQAVHVVIDRHLITGQNETSTLTAVQNLILMCTQKQQQHQQQRASSSSNKYFQH